ncbi:aminotransferase class IV [Spirosoma sp. BT704]|uniref:branched-chain-amino-acid transaminase n=2 Tax=Spirosoma validum TaxID=2771355 RepID=A0A927AZR5_9BACT|nr:aminotransferase class IV [Spirosoma validum]
MFLVYNSDILPETTFQLSANDRAFQYGDGLFETIRYANGQLWFWADHFARLSAGMAALQLIRPTGFTAETVYQCILQLLSANELTHQSARVKIQVWRQPGGLYTPTVNTTNILITAQSGPDFSITEKARVAVYNAFRLSLSPVSAFKTLNALPYVLAGLYKEQHSLNDIILLDTEGNVAECLASNLFWFFDQTLHTPSLQTGCINGIIRQQLVRLAPTVGISVSEGLYQPAVFSKAEAIFCANVMGIQWLRYVNNIRIDENTSSSIDAEKLLNSLFAELHR